MRTFCEIDHRTIPLEICIRREMTSRHKLRIIIRGDDIDQIESASYFEKHKYISKFSNIYTYMKIEKKCKSAESC